MGNRTIDLRVSTLPTQFGESVVLRVLDRTAVNLEIESLGFPKYLYDYVHRSHPAPQRHLRGYGPDRLWQDHHPLLLPAAGQHH